MIDYWTTLIAHWTKRQLDELGYGEPDDMSVVHLVEVSTNQEAFLHYKESDKVCNIIVPNTGILYKFLTDKNYRGANCVFRVSPPMVDYDVEFLKINNYGRTTTTSEYIVFENVDLTSLDNLESCSVVSQNLDDLDDFKKPFPLDLLARVWKLFGL